MASIIYVCPKCGDKSFDEGLCKRCNLAEKIETKYHYGDIQPPQELNKKIFEEYVKDNPLYDPHQAELTEIKLAEQRRKMDYQVLAARAQQQNQPHCPYCNSTNVKKISTANRMLSIGVFGLASGKIGKNFECLNCKAKW